jgi:uncharacterized protein YkwD
MRRLVSPSHALAMACLAVAILLCGPATSTAEANGNAAANGTTQASNGVHAGTGLQARSKARAAGSDRHVAGIAAIRPFPQPAATATGYQWIDYFRSLAGLGAVTPDAGWQAQEAVHVRYLADNSQACEADVHDELTTATPTCPANPHATAAGKVAANNSNVTRVNAPVADETAVQNWFVSAFHALTLLEPRLQRTGYAAYYTPNPRGAGPDPYQFTAAVDVYRGRSGSYDGRMIAFPATGAVTPLLSYRVGTETPEPFLDSLPTAPCHSWGQRVTVSAPMIVQWPVGTALPSGAAVVTDQTAKAPLATCALTAAQYPAGSLAGEFLRGTNRVTQAALYYADVPFQPGHEYRLSIGGHAVTTFTTVAS